MRRFIALCVLGVGVLLLLVMGSLVLWSRRPGPGAGQLVRIELPPNFGALQTAQHLRQRGLVERPWLFAAYLALLQPSLELEPGEHLVLDSLSARDLVGLLARLKNRAHTKVALIEGWYYGDVADKLERAGVCPRDSFEDAVFDPALLERAGIEGPSAEGYLFPATYELPLNSSADTVVLTLVTETKKRLAKIERAHAGAWQELSGLHGFGEHELLTLASIVEKEAVDPAELPVIASVFFNRLRDPTFRPARMLQSDPTAGYGCRVEPDRAPSCADFSGQVRPEMLRDEKNRYNTYRNPGLPPGPIANPGEAAILGVLLPADTEFLFFVANGNGKHTFSSNFDDHQAAIHRLRNRSPSQ